MGNGLGERLRLGSQIYLKCLSTRFVELNIQVVKVGIEWNWQWTHCQRFCAFEILMNVNRIRTWNENTLNVVVLFVMKVNKFQPGDLPATADAGKMPCQDTCCALVESLHKSRCFSLVLLGYWCCLPCQKETFCINMNTVHTRAWTSDRWPVICTGLDHGCCLVRLHATELQNKVINCYAPPSPPSTSLPLPRKVLVVQVTWNVVSVLSESRKILPTSRLSRLWCQPTYIRQVFRRHGSCVSN